MDLEQPINYQRKKRDFGLKQGEFGAGKANNCISGHHILNNFPRE